MQRRVVIGVPALSFGDAVSNDVIGMYYALVARGVDVRVFPSDVAIALSLQIIDVNHTEAFLDDPKHLFIYHFCGAWDTAEVLLAALKCKRIIRYHNVTPPEFFAGIDEGYATVCRDGRNRIDRMAGWADEVWGDSAYNVSEFIAAGFPAERCSIIPPFHHTGELLATQIDAELAERLDDGHRNILVVGRIAPNKNHLSLIRAFAKVREKNHDVRLVLVGGSDARLTSYIDSIHKLIEELSLGDAVMLAGKLSSAGLATAYRRASVFAITSKHEGFCVPLVEAMALGVPVVALARTAVIETLGDAGWLVNDDTPEALALALDEALNDPEKISNAVVAGRKRYQRVFSQEAIENRLLEVISPLIPSQTRGACSVHQFHSGTAMGDAVTNGMFLTQRLLRELGFKSEIFAEHIDRALVGNVRDFRTFAPDESDVLFLHHSMGHDQDAWLKNLRCRKVLVYHNITPESFFPPESPYRHYSVKGRAQLLDFKPDVEAAIADSELNAAELHGVGYADIEVLPLLVDVADIAMRPWNDALVQEQSPVFTVLFVGRVSPNKCQQHLLLVADQLRSLLRRPFQFVFVGGYDEGDPYYQRLRVDIERLELGDIVRLTGKVSEADLYAWYRAADIFLCLSEHEGFGVPLIEAMTFDLPVIAYRSSNVGATLGGAGLLLNDKHPRGIASLIRILADDRALRRTVIEGQRLRIRRFAHASLLSQLSTFLIRQGISVPIPPPAATQTEDGLDRARLRYQIEGPFETSYSLALVNREIAFALDHFAPGHVGLFATEGPGDYQPSPASIETVGATALWQRGSKRSGSDVVIRNLYPPRVADMDGLVNLLNFAWEESGLSQEWVRSFNANLDGMLVPSHFVRKALLDNGVSLPVAAAGNGVDHIDRVSQLPYDGDIGEGFRFLHVSSCFPRKGADVLIDAFAAAFRDDPDVTLIIKTFANPHNTIAADVARLKREHPAGPHFVVIEEDWPAGQIVDLYKKCDAFVAPSRGEGFGLPMAEAMWFGKPVITTGFGGQSDFCTSQTAWLVDYRFAPAQTHMGLFDSVWAEPDKASLMAQLRAVRQASSAELQPRLERARALMEREYTWERCAERARELEHRIRAESVMASNKLNVAWVSSWNTKCGIAIYSDFLTKGLDQADFDMHVFASMSNETIVADTEQVTRCWTDRYGPATQLLEALDRYEPDVIVLQHNFAFFSTSTVAELVRFGKRRGIPVVITFHSTKDVTIAGAQASLSEIASDLKFADRLLVHGVDDLNRLREWGLVDNTAIIPHGVQMRRSASIAEARLPLNLPQEAKVVATYGFFLPHKGLEQMVDAFAIILKEIPDAYLLMVNALYPEMISDETANACRARVRACGLGDRVRMITDFLPDRESFAYLDAADLVVFPYQETAESSSAAARYGMATNRPVACSPLSIFDDLNEVNHRLTGTKPENIATSVIDLLQDDALLASKAKAQQVWLAAKSWDQVSMRLAGMLTGLVRAKRWNR